MTADLPEPLRQGEQRVSDAEREVAVERLSDVAAEGRIDLGELDTRLGKALSARTRAELESVTADLPPVAAEASKVSFVLEGGLLGIVCAGRWAVPARVSVSGGLGGATIDFCQAVCRLSEVDLEVQGEEGGVTVIVPRGWTVVAGGTEAGFSGLKDTTTSERWCGWSSRCWSLRGL